MEKKYTILLADDHNIMRSGISEILNNQPNMEVIHEVDNGRDAYQAAITLQPNLLLTDLSMPKTNGTECIHNLKKRSPEIKVIVLTMHSGEEHVHDALNAGADGYILKEDSRDELLLAINNVLNGKKYLSPSISSHIVDGYLNKKDYGTKTITSWNKLTRREREVLKLIAEGFRNKDIAEYLSISIKTVGKHRSNLMKKLDLHNISSLTNYAIQNNLIN